jgi:asparagine N-glycosylation enzyme membrane subunit Stt3
MSEDTIAATIMAPFMCLSGVFPCFFGIIWLFFMTLTVFGVILWIIMLIDLIKRDDKEFPSSSKDQKMLWLLIVLLTGWIGGVIYYFMVYKKVGAAK